MSVGPVVVIGAGLVGSSIGMALTRAGERVHLEDSAASHARVAATRGAGTVAPASTDDVRAVVVATPPSAIPHVVAEALLRFPHAVVTDVGSVKAPVADAVAEFGADTSRFVPSHPMAGSQFTGPMTASAELFHDRAWVVTPVPGNSEAHVAVVRALAEACGARVVELAPHIHDEAVAQVSHVPHLMSILTASHLRGVPGEHLLLAGQGIRDVTRIAGSDPGLWRQIITTNAQAVRGELLEVARDLEYLIGVLDRPDELESFLRLGQHGARSVSGKHGRRPQELVVVTVEIPDEPRALARLFTDVGDVGFNIEDFELTHDALREVGYLSIAVEISKGGELCRNLQERGWSAWSNTAEEQP